MADSLSSGITTVSVTSFSLSMFLGAGLSQLWSLINTILILLYFLMLQNSKYPSNVVKIHEVFVKLKDFELFKIGDYLGDLLYLFPIVGPISLGALACGIESTYAADNLGTTQWLGFLFLLLIILSFANICGPYTKCVLSSARWNGPLTFFV